MWLVYLSKNIYYRDTSLFCENTKNDHRDCSVNNIFYLQSNIRLDHSFCGHLTLKFDEFFSKYSTKPNRTRKLISLILNEFLNLWEIQNNKVHGETPQQKQHAYKQQLLRSVINIYKDNKVMAEDRDNFHPSPAEHLREHTSTNQIKNQIKMICPIIQRIKKKFKKQLATKLISHYFPSLWPEKKRKNKKFQIKTFKNSKTIQNCIVHKMNKLSLCVHPIKSDAAVLLDKIKQLQYHGKCKIIVCRFGNKYKLEGRIMHVTPDQII